MNVGAYINALRVDIFIMYELPLDKKENVGN